MSTEENKAIVRRFIDEPWNKGNLQVLDEVCAPTYSLRGGGITELKAGITAARKAYPDLHFKIEEMIAEGDKVAFRWTMSGTGPDENETAVISTGITIVRFADGKIVEDRYEASTPEQQLQPA